MAVIYQCDICKVPMTQRKCLYDIKNKYTLKLTIVPILGDMLLDELDVCKSCRIELLQEMIKEEN